jgi:hypothetical protein
MTRQEEQEGLDQLAMLATEAAAEAAAAAAATRGATEAAAADEAAAVDGAAALPDLDGGALLQFLNSTLQDLETAQGEEDDEARALLAQLGASLSVQRRVAAGAGGGSGTSAGAAAGDPQRPPLAPRAPLPAGGIVGDPHDVKDLELEIASQIDRWAEWSCDGCLAVNVKSRSR